MTAGYIRLSACLAAIMLPLLPGSPAAAQQPAQTYASPLGNFSVPVPGGIGRRTQHQNDNDAGIVAFHDDFGGYRAIFYIRMSPRALALQNDPEAQRADLASFLDDYAMKYLFTPASPAASVLHREDSKSGEDNVHYAIVSLPESSTMFDMKNKKRYDTRRGVMIFARGAFIYMLSSGENPSVLELGSPEKPLQALVDSEKKKLQAFASTISFK